MGGGARGARPGDGSRAAEASEPLLESEEGVGGSSPGGDAVSAKHTERVRAWWATLQPEAVLLGPADAMPDDDWLR